MAIATAILLMIEDSCDIAPSSLAGGGGLVGHSGERNAVCDHRILTQRNINLHWFGTALSNFFVNFTRCTDNKKELAAIL
jgi:hypothetical protein